MWSIQPGNDSGPARAERRARLKGLTVGRSVAEQCRGWLGVGDPPSSPLLVPYSERTYAGPGGATPLEFGERLTNYRLQVATRDHCLTGRRWQPTARQYRRLERKARHAQAPFGRKHPDYVSPTRGRATMLPVLDEPARVTPVEANSVYRAAGGTGAKPQRERSAINPSGFRVVDRRGEHRS
jgi:hypothetical protein